MRTTEELEEDISAGVNGDNEQTAAVTVEHLRHHDTPDARLSYATVTPKGSYMQLKLKCPFRKTVY
jgi:hypothetical protein